MNKESGRGLFPIYCNAYLYLDPSLNLIRFFFIIIIFVSCILIKDTCFTIIKCKCVSVTKIPDSACMVVESRQ